MTDFSNTDAVTAIPPSQAGRSTADNRPEPDKGDELLTREFDQAWNHYRHLESLRSQYLGFFFTLTIGTAAFAVPALRKPSLDQAPTVLAAGAFLTIYCLFIMTLYLAVRKAGVVMDQYDDVIQYVRGHCYENSPHGDKLRCIRDRPHAVMQGRLRPLFSIRLGAESTLMSFAVLAIIGGFAVVVRMIQIHGSTPQVMAAIAVVLPPAGLVLAIAALDRRKTNAVVSTQRAR